MVARWRVSGHGAAVAAVVVALLGSGAVIGGLVVLTTGTHAQVLVAQVPTGGRLSPSGGVPSGFASPEAARVDQHIPPIEVAVPALGIRSRLIGLRLNSDGSLQVPQDYAVAGWYSDGPAPGDKGAPAVIVGHVDSRNGPGVFYRLPELKRGDVVLVRRADGTDVRFLVYRSVDYPKDSFPASQVYAARSTPEIRLITCTGAFDRHSGHYLSNRVVYARQAPA